MNIRADNLKMIMSIEPINTPADYSKALQEIESLMMAKLGTLEGDRLDALATMIEEYEAKHFMMPLDLAFPFHQG